MLPPAATVSYYSSGSRHRTLLRISSFPAALVCALATAFGLRRRLPWLAPSCAGVRLFAPRLAPRAFRRRGPARVTALSQVRPVRPDERHPGLPDRSLRLRLPLAIVCMMEEVRQPGSGPARPGQRQLQLPGSLWILSRSFGVPASSSLVYSLGHFKANALPYRESQKLKKSRFGLRITRTTR